MRKAKSKMRDIRGGGGGGGGGAESSGINAAYDEAVDEAAFAPQRSVRSIALGRLCFVCALLRVDRRISAAEACWPGRSGSLCPVASHCSRSSDLS